MPDSKIFQLNLAKVINRRRQTLGISQEELASRATLHRTYISDVEKGERNISLESLRKIATALESPMWEVIQEAESFAVVTNNCE